MRKKLITLALCVAMGCTLAACGSAGKKSVSNEYIKVENYNNLEIQKVDDVEVTDEEVDMTVEGNVEASSELEEVEGKAENGHTVNIDYVGSVKGKEFDGGSAEGFDLELGSGTFIGENGKYKSFEEQIVGHKAGDKFTIEVKFPDEYQSEDLAGKVAKFDITLNKVQKNTTPELSDDWVKANSETAKTVDEYKEEIKKELQDEQDSVNKDTLRKEVLEALQKEIVEEKKPEEEIKKVKESITSMYENYAQMYGMEFKDFVSQLMGMTEEQFETQAEEAAQQSAELNMACQLIAEKEKLTPSEEEYKAKYDEMAKEYGFENGDAFIEQYGEEDIKDSILQEIVCDYLVEHAKQVEASELSTEEFVEEADDAAVEEEAEANTAAEADTTAE